MRIQRLLASIAALVGLVGLVAMLSARSSTPIQTGSVVHSDESPEQSTLSMPFAADMQSIPNCSLSGSETFDAGETPIWTWELSDFIDSGHEIIKGVITTTSEYRFGTPDGAPPPPLPPAATSEDEEDEIYNSSVYRVAVIDVTHEFTGTGATGYVVKYPGGVHPDCPNWKFKVNPQVMSGGEGDSGILITYEPHPTLFSDPTPAFQALIDTRDELNLNPNVNYEIRLALNWFLYEGTDATSGWLGTMSSATLESEIESAIGP